MKLPRVAGQPGQGGLVQQGIWTAVVRGVRVDFAEPNMSWTLSTREAEAVVVRRRVVTLRRVVGFMFGGMGRGLMVGGCVMLC